MLSAMRQQGRIIGERDEMEREQRLSEIKGKMAALEDLPQDLMAQAERRYQQREQWLQQLGKEARKRIVESVPLQQTEARSISDEDFARSSKVFAEFNKGIGEAEARLNEIQRRMKRWKLLFQTHLILGK